MTQVKTVTEWMAERGLDLKELIATTALDDRVVKAIVGNRYTPSPEQRRRRDCPRARGIQHAAGNRARMALLAGAQRVARHAAARGKQQLDDRLHLFFRATESVGL